MGGYSVTFAADITQAPVVITDGSQKTIDNPNDNVIFEKTKDSIYESIYLKGTTTTISGLTINADKLNFKGVTDSIDDGVDYFAGWMNGSTELNINVNELYLGSADKGTDRGFQMKGAHNKLNISADRIVAYIGDGFINAQGDGSGTSVANIGSADDRVGHFEVHTGYGKDDWGVAILQANEGNTVNLYADTVILDGPASDKGGVIGTGGYGTVNVDAKDLTIDGNICGSYGERPDPGKVASLNITTDKLNMKGDINIGSLGEKHSNFSRDTVVTINVREQAVIDGDINIQGNTVSDTKNVQNDDSILNLNLNGDSVITGEINVIGNEKNKSTQNVSVNLGGTGDMTASSGIYNVEHGGNVNFTGGTWAVNEWNSESGDGNLSVADGAAVNVNDNINVASVSLNDGSNIVLNGQSDKFKEDAAITAQTYNIGESAGVTVVDVDTNTSVRVFGDNGENEKISDQIKSDNMMQDLVYDAATGKFTVRAADAGKVLAGGVLGNIVTNLTDTNTHVDFFQNVLKSGDRQKAVNAINSLANLGELGGVSHAAYSMSNTMTDSVHDHLSKANHTDADNDIWAKYIHNKENIDGIQLGGMKADYDAQFNGIIVGSDLYRKGKATVGAAFSYADGDISGSNLGSYTKNEAEYYGVSLYGRIDNGDSALLGDISYMHGSSDITQYNTDQKFTASPDTDAFGIGFRAEKVIETNGGRFVPYAGLRYMHLGTGDYTNNIGMKYDVDEQNILLLPVGVKYSTEIKNNGWTVRPIAEAGYVWAVGDRDTDQTVSLNGAYDGFGFDVADEGSFIGKLGLEMENDSVTYGIGYEYQKGDTVKSNRWLANMTFRF